MKISALLSTPKRCKVIVKPDDQFDLRTITVKDHKCPHEQAQAHPPYGQKPN